MPHASEAKDWKCYVSLTVVRWFKMFPYFGRTRFWILYWAYRLTGWHIRHEEWDFVLNYLPQLHKWQKVFVMDVGCSRSLFVHELAGRGYRVAGMDLEPFQGRFPYNKQPHGFFLGDIRNCQNRNIYNFVTCISVLEHIKENKKLALENMINLIVIGGRVLITIPTNEFAQGHEWHGFYRKHFEQILLPENARIIEYTERAGQICMALERTI